MYMECYVDLLQTLGKPVEIVWVDAGRWILNKLSLLRRCYFALPIVCSTKIQQEHEKQAIEHQNGWRDEIDPVSPCSYVHKYFCKA